MRLFHGAMVAWLCAGVNTFERTRGMRRSFRYRRSFMPSWLFPALSRASIGAGLVNPVGCAGMRRESRRNPVQHGRRKASSRRLYFDKAETPWFDHRADDIWANHSIPAKDGLCGPPIRRCRMLIPNAAPKKHRFPPPSRESVAEGKCRAWSTDEGRSVCRRPCTDTPNCPHTQ